MCNVLGVRKTFAFYLMPHNWVYNYSKAPQGTHEVSHVILLLLMLLFSRKQVIKSIYLFIFKEWRFEATWLLHTAVGTKPINTEQLNLAEEQDSKTIVHYRSFSKVTYMMYLNHCDIFFLHCNEKKYKPQQYTNTLWC